MSAPASLAFEGLRYRYEAGSEALRNLGAEVAPGEVTAILGPNGAGKTTLLHLALGWLKPICGRVLLDGVPISEMSRRELGKTLALVPQSERIPFEFSVLDYVLLGRAPHLGPLASPGDPDLMVARAAIDLVGIEALADREVTGLSGGERQLASIARALTQEPRILLLDEPTSHLDLANKARVMGLVKSLAQNGMTVLLTTHEPDVASGAATRLLLMREGQLLEAGTTETLFASASLSRTYGISVEATMVHGRRVALWEPLGTERARSDDDKPWLALWHSRVEAKARARLAAGKGLESEYWNGRGREYDERAKPKFEKPNELRDFVLGHIAPGSTICDIGAGTGLWTAAFARRGARVVAVEPCSDMRSVLRERAETERLADVSVIEDAWPLSAPPAFDIAFSAHAMYGAPDFAAFVGAMDEAASSRCMLILRACAPDGFMAKAAMLVHGEPYEGPNLHIAYHALLELGIQPSLLAEEKPRFDERRYESPEEALAAVKERLGLYGPCGCDNALAELLDHELVRDPRGCRLILEERSGLLYWPSKQARASGT